MERIRAASPESVVEQMLRPWPPLARKQLIAELSDRDTVLDAALRCLIAKHYLLDGRQPSPTIVDSVRHTVATCYDRAAPLRLSISIGCFKSPRLQTAPYADWSEFLHLRYMLARAAELADIFPFGVELSYVLLDLSTDLIAGISGDHADDYRASFEELVQHLSAGLRPDVTLTSAPLSELVSRHEYEAGMRESLECVCAAWRDLPAERVSAEMDKSRRAHLHIEDAGVTRVEDAAKLHMALLRLLPELAPYRDPGCLHILLRKHQGDVQRWLSQKSYRNSIVQFWIGSGCIAVTAADRCTATILSPNQIAARRLVGSIDGFAPPARNPNLRAVPVYA